MAQYLLKATDDEMRRWKANAESANVSFADWIRAKLDGVTPQQHIADRLGKRSYKPDPKGPPREKKERFR